MRAIQQRDVNLALLHRPLPAPFALEEISVSSFTALQMVFERGDDSELIAAELDHVLDLHANDALDFYNDVMSITLGFIDATDSRLVGIRLEKFEGEKCPSFHVDRLGFRAVTTYRGATTQWLRNADVTRSNLEPRRLEIGPHACTQSFDVGAIGIMKGESEFNPLGGLVHRSPPAREGAGSRILLRIDSLQ